ncbi:MAG: type IV pilus assembly protein PilM [bacterium]|nr:type IV pilus assembly protein PilM [bacterium]
MISSKLWQYFPPPKYLQIPSWGLDISDRSFKFAQLVEEQGELRLGRFGRKAIPEGIIQSGEIKNKEALRDLLKSNFAGPGSGGVVLSLPEEKAFVGLVTLPKMPAENIREALELSLDEYVPLPASQAVFDFELIKNKESLDHLDLVVVAFPRALAETYLETAKEAGLRPLAFELETHALARAVLSPGEEDSVMVIDFGRTRISFIIISGGVVRFTSTVTVAGEALDQALSKIFKVDIIEAERMKKERGLVRSQENQEVFNAILPIVSTVQDEMVRHITFWKNHTQHLHAADSEVKRVYLCGGDANLTGLPEYLSYELKLPVKLANPWVNITRFAKYVPEITYRESISYATALGLALHA